MELRLQKIEQTYVLGVIGELDCHNYHKLMGLYERMVALNNKHLVLDMDDAHSIDEIGIESFEEILRIASEQDLDLCVANVHGCVRNALEKSGLLHVFPEAATVEEALQIVSSTKLD